MFSAFRIFILLLIVFAASSAASAQGVDASSATPSSRNQNREDEYPSSITENLAKLRIKAARKEFDELVERIEETATISAELDKSYETSQNLNPTDTKKIERLEKLVSKIRSQIGAESDDEENALAVSNANIGTVIKNIKDDAAQLLSEVKKTGRFAVSVVAIESSNSMRKLVRYIKQKAQGK